MQVSISNAFNRVKKKNNNNNNNNNINVNSRRSFQFSPVPKDSVSFGDGGGLAIYLAGKASIDIIINGKKYSKLGKILKDVECLIAKPFSNKESLPSALFVLGKTPNTATESFLYSCINYPNVSDLKKQALSSSILSLIPDNNNVNIQLKKDFISRLIEDGSELSADFVDQFKRLEDQHYGGFKQTIVDKCLYSKEYKEKLGSGLSNSARRNLALIDNLNPDFHKAYLQKNAQEIVSQQKTVFNSLKNNELYAAYQVGFTNSSVDRNIESIDKYAKYLFHETIKSFGSDKEKIAKSLNMDKFLVDDIFKDIEVKEQISKETDKSNILKIHAGRIKQKLEHSNEQIKNSALYWCENSGMGKDLIKYFDGIQSHGSETIKDHFVDLVEKFGNDSYFYTMLDMIKDVDHTNQSTRSKARGVAAKFTNNAERKLELKEASEFSNRHPSSEYDNTTIDLWVSGLQLP